LSLRMKWPSSSLSTPSRTPTTLRHFTQFDFQ
jgi:hypothetical protein